MENRSSMVYALAHQQLQEKINTLPINLSAMDIAGFLGISKGAAYALVHQPNFPMKSLPGIRRLIIPKVKFLEWYLSDSKSEDCSDENEML